MFSFFKHQRKNNLTQDLFNEWLKLILQTEQPNSKIIAYNFGIFESPNGYKLYFAGFESYEKDNDDWAVGLGDFTPRNNYFDLPNHEFKNLEWESVLDRVVALIKTFMSTKDFENSFLKNSVAITSGFDDGELIRIN